MTAGSAADRRVRMRPLPGSGQNGFVHKRTNKSSEGEESEEDEYDEEVSGDYGDSSDVDDVGSDSVKGNTF